MSIQIEVRQNEVIVVQGTNMAEVSHLFTVGLKPCIGLVLWHESICALGHFHDWESMEQCAPLISHFKECSSQGKRTAVIVRAKGATSKEAWHSEHMSSDLANLLSQCFPVTTVNNVYPAPLGEGAKVKVNLSNGKIDYVFDYALPSDIKRDPAAATTTWVSRPWSSKDIIFGFYDGSSTINYKKGSEEYI